MNRVSTIPETDRRHPAIAAVLNFIVPGAGLWYLGRAGLGLVNLAAATAIVLGLGGWLLERDALANEVHYLWLAVAAGSAGLAHAIAVSRRSPP